MILTSLDKPQAAPMAAQMAAPMAAGQPAFLPAPVLPAWVINVPASEALGAQGVEAAAFLSGASLALLHMVVHDALLAAPADLLRSRFALKATAACLKHEGRSDSEAALRDAYLLTKPGDSRGPAGDRVALWLDATSLILRNKGWQERLVALLPLVMQEHAQKWLGAMCDSDGQGSPIALAAISLRRVITAFPREEAIAFLFADVALARALGWPQIIPLAAHYLKRKDLRADGPELLVAFHNAIVCAANDATRLAHDLARRAARLRAIAPKLRAHGSDEAIQLFLSRDAILPATMLSPKIQGTNVAMSDRAARRLCDRLVELGVVRELTGRGTFRLYGV